MDKKPLVQHKVLTFNELSLHYKVWGEGENALMAFHGFGRSSHDFLRFTRPFLDTFTVYAFDIFFHGKSHTGKRIPADNPLKEDELVKMIGIFLEENTLEKTWIMGYSLGGRISLKIAELIPDKVGGLYLFAPDGLIVNRWYALLSHYALGRSFFRFFRKNNRPFYWILNSLHRTGIISSRVVDFVESQIKTPEMQEQVYNVWTFLRKIEPDFRRLSEGMKKYPFTVDLFFGYYDKIIPEKNARKFLKYCPEVEVHLLRAGHVLLTGANAELIARQGLLQLPDKR